MAKNVKLTTPSTIVKQVGFQKPPKPIITPTVQRPITAEPPVVALTGAGVKPLQSSGYTQKTATYLKPLPPSGYPGTQRNYTAAPNDKVLGKLAAFQEKTPDKTMEKTLGDTGLTKGQMGDAARYTARAISLGHFPNLMSPTLAQMMGLTEAERASLGYNPNWPYNRLDPSNGPGLGDGGGGGGLGGGRRGVGSGFGGALSRGEAFFVGTYNWRIGP